MGVSARPVFIPLKWQRKHVDSVTSMWVPTTIWEWQLVQRSWRPRRGASRCGLWSKMIPRLKTTLPWSSRRSWQPERSQLASSTSAKGLEEYVWVAHFTTCVSARYF
jgi:hypothetical protein